MATMHDLTIQDYRDGWRLVCEMSEAAHDAVSFARHGVTQLPRLVPSEITTLSVCDLRRNTRSVVSSPEEAISSADRACFNHFFEVHPLVRYHSSEPLGKTARISDLPAGRSF